MIRYPETELNIDGVSIKIPFIRKRQIYESYIEKRITQEDIGNGPNIYSYLAEKYYYNKDLWYIIDDANPMFVESAITVGMKIIIPDITSRPVREL